MRMRLVAALEVIENLGSKRIVSADVGFARALKRQAAGRAAIASTWPPLSLLDVARWAELN